MAPEQPNRTDHVPVAVIVPREAWDELGLQWETIAEAMSAILACLDVGAVKGSVRVGRELAPLLNPPQGVGDALEEVAHCETIARRLRALFDLDDRVNRTFNLDPDRTRDAL